MAYEKREPEVLRNTVRVSDSADGIEFQQMPKGQQIIAFIKAKNITIQTDWGSKPGFRLVFRAKNEDSAFVSKDVTATTHDRGNLIKLLCAMRGEKLNEEERGDADLVFSELQKCMDKWYLASIDHNEWESPKGEKITFVRIDGTNIMAHPEAKKWPKPSEFFKNGRPTTKSMGDQTASFDKYEDAKPEKAEKKTADTPAPPTGGEMLNGFGVYMYDVVFSKDPAIQKKQQAFLDENNGLFCGETNRWHFPVKVEKLENKYIGKYTIPKKAAEKAKAPKKEAEASFDDTDDVPESWDGDEDNIPF